MRSPRILSLRGRISAAVLTATTLVLTAPASALAAERFTRDRTPLSPGVNGGGGDSSSGVSAGSTSGALVRTVIGLAVVLAVIYGVYWLLRTYARSRTSSSSAQIDVIATTTLAPNRTLHLVRSGEEVILVGAAQESITPLRVYSADEARALGLAVEPSPYPQLPPPMRSRTQTGPFLMRFVEAMRQRTVRQ